MAWLWWWFLEQIMAPLAAFFSTLIFLRLAAAITRRALANKKAPQWSTPENVLLFVAPSIVFAIYLLWLRQYQNVIWVSSNAIWLSLAIDAIYLVGLFIYYFKLRRLRREPAFFASQVNLKSSFDVQGIEIVGVTLKYLALQIPIVRRRYGNVLTITNGDFTHFLRGDWRLVDSVEEAPPTITLNELSAFPHLILVEDESNPPPIEQAREFVEDPQSINYRKMYDFAAWAAKEDPALSAIKNNSVKQTVYVVNRALTTALPADLWKTSQNLCKNTPQIIALNWRQFHNQESLRLRFVTLFNTADLMQRLVGAIVFAKLRDAGEFPTKNRSGRNQEIPRSTLEFNETLWWALESSSNTELKLLRRMLLSPREDFKNLQEKLEPFNSIAGHLANDDKTTEHTLMGWRTIGVLRNKLVGHGGIGWQLDINPLLYLNAIHFYFLGMMRDVAVLDLQVIAQTAEVETSAKNEKSSSNVRSNTNTRAVIKMIGTDDIISLTPYLRFYNQRLLVFNRISRGKVEYIDYNATNITEPSFVSFDEDLRLFKEKS